MPRKTPRETAARIHDRMLASMRPRPDAAENLGGSSMLSTETTCCFNEAAARCRGKPVFGCTRWRSTSGLQ